MKIGVPLENNGIGLGEGISQEALTLMTDDYGQRLLGIGQQGY